MDADARAYLQTLLNAGGRGLRGRGDELAEILRASAPTLRRTRRVSEVLAQRDRKLARLVHNLRALSETTAPALTATLAALLSTSTATFEALAREGDALPPGPPRCR